MRYDSKPKEKTTTKFKVGDKVHVDSDGFAEYFGFHIRAIITEIDPKLGYLLRAFQKDLPGIYMFNVWDCDLTPRTSGARKLWEATPAILQKLSAILGGDVEAKEWFNTPQKAFGMSKPCELIGEEKGLLQIKQEIARLEYGVYS